MFVHVVLRYNYLLLLLAGLLTCGSCTRKVNSPPVDRPFEEGVSLLPIPPPEPARPVYLPVLAYHRITPEGSSDMIVPPERFAQHMAFLAERGYTPISLDQWGAAVEHDAPLPPRPVAITFDDGWADQFTHARPVLARYGFPATFYVYTAFLGSPAAMTWEQLRALAAEGHAIGCHSATHSDLTKPFKTETPAKYAGRLVRETDQVRRTMEAHVRAPVRHYCYPYGYYNTNVIDHVRQAGYATAVTVNPAVNGRQTPRHSMGRFIVAPWTTPAELAQYLRSKPLHVQRVMPGDGSVSCGPVSCVSAHVPHDPALPLCNVRVKWNWQWRDCRWDRSRDTVTWHFGRALEPGFYTAQVHAWDVASNHYVYAWTFQQMAANRTHSHAAALPAPEPRLALLNPTGARNE